MPRMHLRTEGGRACTLVSQPGLLEVQTGARPTTGSSSKSQNLTTQLKDQVQTFEQCVKLIHGVLYQDVVGPGFNL